MFIEPYIKNLPDNRHPSGWIEVICGCMFSGKTEELIRRLKRALIANQKVEIFKPLVDTRYHKDQVVSHDDTSIRSTAVNFARDILLQANNCQVIGIDEVQFFDQDIVEVCVKLADSGTRIIAAGLDMDFKGNPFGPMPDLMAKAEFVTKVHAICVRCGDIASYSYRIDPATEQVMVGHREAYEARCRSCFNLGPKA